MHLMKKKCSSSAHVLGFWNKMVTTDMQHPLRSETKRTRTLQRPGWNSLVVMVGGAITILKNDGVRQWEGRHPIYEMETKSSPPTSGTSHHKPTIYAWNHQPDQECRVHWVHRTGISWIVGLKQLNAIVRPDLQTRQYWSYIGFVHGQNSTDLPATGDRQSTNNIQPNPTEFAMEAVAHLVRWVAVFLTWWFPYSNLSSRHPGVPWLGLIWIPSSKWIDIEWDKSYRTPSIYTCSQGSQGSQDPTVFQIDVTYQGSYNPGAKEPWHGDRKQTPDANKRVNMHILNIITKKQINNYK